MSARIFQLALLFLLPFYSSNAQTYIPTIVDGAEWTELHYFEGASTSYQKVAQDSIVDGVAYKWIEGNGGLLREDTLERRIYYLRGDSASEETVLYDYSLQVGDSFGEFIVDSISNEIIVSSNIFSFWEVLLLNLDTRVFYLSGGLGYGGNREIWIEGIGSNYGLFKNTTSLLCHHNAKGELDFSARPFYTPGVEDCMLILSVNNTRDLFREDIYPNPASSSIQVKFAEFISNGHVDIVDIHGKVMNTISFTGEDLEIEVANIPAGIYILQLYDGAEPVGNRKFVKM